jgi:hypothetical protein
MTGVAVAGLSQLERNPDNLQASGFPAFIRSYAPRFTDINHERHQLQAL